MGKFSCGESIKTNDENDEKNTLKRNFVAE